MTSKTRKKLRDRKYLGGHQTLRRRLEPEVAAGLWVCAKCGGPFLPGEKWDLGHDEHGGYRGPEHVRCNRATNVCDTSRQW